MQLGSGGIKVDWQKSFSTRISSLRRRAKMRSSSKLFSFSYIALFSASVKLFSIISFVIFVNVLKPFVVFRPILRVFFRDESYYCSFNYFKLPCF